MSRQTTLLLGLTVVLIAACGRGEAKSDETQIREVTESFVSFAFLGKGDAGKAYELLDAAAQEKCSQDQLVDHWSSMRVLFAVGGINTPRAESLRLEKVFDIQVVGDTATARIDFRVAGQPTDSSAVPVSFKREGGSWKVSDGC